MLERLLTWVRENKPKAIMFGFIGLIVFGFINLKLIHFSSSPPFCKGMCHNMDLEVDQWEKSSHGKRGIDCVTCHYREGIFHYAKAKVGAMKSLKNSIFKTIGFPMHDPHEQEELEHHYELPAPGGLVFTTEMMEEEKKMDHIILPQYVHNEEIDAHYWGGPSTFADEDGNYRIQIHRHSYLWNNIELNCRGCHSSRGNRGTFSPKKTADYIIKNSLLSFKGQVERRRKGIVVPHAIHLDQGIACIDCHTEIVHATDEHMNADGTVLPRMEICFKCHNNRRASRDCTLCHEVQKKMNLGVSGVGVEDTPNYMYPDSTECTDCHMEENDWKMTPQICADCHGDDEYGPMMTDWQTSTNALVMELEPMVEEVGHTLKAAKDKGRNVEKAAELYADAVNNYDLVVNDGSKGAHNLDYAAALLEVAKTKLTSASERLME